METKTLEIPKSIQTEHAAIHSALVEATRAGGRVGPAAKELAEILHPRLHSAARAEQATRYEQLAEQLALHAQTEEEVLYPAAVLVGDIIRARSNSNDRVVSTRPA